MIKTFFLHIVKASNNEAKEDDVLLLRMDVNDVESHQKNFDKILSHFGQVMSIFVHFCYYSLS